MNLLSLGDIDLSQILGFRQINGLQILGGNHTVGLRLVPPIVRHGNITHGEHVHGGLMDTLIEGKSTACSGNHNGKHHNNRDDAAGLFRLFGSCLGPGRRIYFLFGILAH